MKLYIITILLILVFCVFISTLIIRAYRRSMTNLYDELLQKLDRAIAGKSLETAYDESLDAAVTMRLNRIIEISGMQKEQAEGERDIIKSLISDISHQIRTPLSNITLYTGLLKEHVTDEQSLMFAQKIEKNAGKLEEAKSLLTFSKKSLSEISNYLCFSTQSYFQNVFKKKYGVTPKQYRIQARKIR